ncbi:MAG: FAD-dependent oxidoreductase [Patescibacteria group bacterium]
MIYDVIVIGGGPAGTAAAVYAARKRLKTILITDSFGGQSIVSDDIQNWIGETRISGYDLAKKFENHIRAYSDMVDVKIPEKVLKVRKIGDTFEVDTDKKNTYGARTVIAAAGAGRRRLNVPGEKEFEGRGVAYCSTCDAPLFSGKKVAVVGGGNAGLEAVEDLFPYASEIYLLEYGETLKGDPVTQTKIKKNAKLKEIILNAETLAIKGDKMVTGLKYKNLKSGDIKELELDGVFVEIGSAPNSDMLKDLVELDGFRQVVIDSKHASTSQPGIFAAGDITDDPYKQNNISAGDAVKAALAAHHYLLKKFQD